MHISVFTWQRRQETPKHHIRLHPIHDCKDRKDESFSQLSKENMLGFFLFCFLLAIPDKTWYHCLRILSDLIT